LVLRDLGLPLGEIAEVLSEEVTIDQLRGILGLRRQQAHARLHAQEEQLARVEARLAHPEDVHLRVAHKHRCPSRLTVPQYAGDGTLPYSLMMATPTPLR
ncbi:MAG: hypothetical protein ACRDV8_03560, partial [Acidimicrobiales bacterium]